VPARWDEETVFHAVSFGKHQARTLYDGVFEIPPGHFLLVTEKHAQVNQYWDFNYPATSAPKRSDAEYAAEFREVFEEAVRIRLRADVPVGVYLSGGLDSCSVLALAARHHPEPIRASGPTDTLSSSGSPTAAQLQAVTGRNLSADSSAGMTWGSASAPSFAQPFWPESVKYRGLGQSPNFIGAVRRTFNSLGADHRQVEFLGSDPGRSMIYHSFLRFWP